MLTHEPGGTLLGNKLRRWVKWGRGVTVQTELFLFLASRSQLVTRVIRPALEKGNIVICDRYDASTFAYQGYGRGMDLDFLKNVNSFVTDGLFPDLIVLLDLSAEQGLERKKMKLDVFEREEFLFHQKVREGYLKMAAADPERWMVIDATLPEVKIREIIWERVSQLLQLSGFLTRFSKGLKPLVLFPSQLSLYMPASASRSPCLCRCAGH